jgi:hypothetical protein
MLAAVLAVVVVVLLAVDHPPHDVDKRSTGNEAPMVITPRDLVRLARQLTDQACTVARSGARRRADRVRRPDG